MNIVKSVSCIVLCLLAPLAVGAVEVKPIGDLRTGYYSKKDGDSELRLRLRAGVKAKFSQRVSGDFRVAGRVYAWGNNDTGFDYLDATPAYSDSIPAGQATIDTAFIKYNFSKSNFIRLGRFQSKYELMGVAKKSLDRNNSPNSDIAWTDGLHFSVALGKGHRVNAIVQYNPEDATAVLREPLNFKADKSRLSYFLGVQHTKPAGPFVQREVDITVMPNALCENGLSGDKSACDSGSATTYVAAVARVATQWQVMDTRTKFLLGTEIGYSPTRPIDKNASGDASGLAYQMTFNFMDFLPKHSIGFVYGRAGGGWLISPDFSSNNTLKEVRYAWKFAKKQKLELRLRQRDKISGSGRSKDLYLRYTLKY